MTDRDLAGIARDACPYCGERVKVSALDLFPSHSRPLVTCGACGQKSEICARARIGGGGAGLLGVVIAVALTVRTSATLSIVVAAVAYPLCNHMVSRLMLRLDPPERAE